ncbi:hypothetical protein ACIPW5_37005 [Streptomyces sp. NPDC090077]|uniref:hypothetical protein n=1 Tax=Streptomyces sp. NPDC090077 TaxID=3365938 RepID=UPI003830FBB8
MYDPGSGRLTVCPESSAWATKARLEQTRLMAAADRAAVRTVVTSLRILSPGAAPIPGPTNAAPMDPAPAAPTGPPRTRETACEGYRRADAAHQEAAPPRRTDPGIPEAVKRQNAATRELSRRAFPDDTPTPIDPARAQRLRQAAVTEAAALRRARAERIDRQASTQTALPQQPAALHMTA